MLTTKYNLPSQPLCITVDYEAEPSIPHACVLLGNGYGQYDVVSLYVCPIPREYVYPLNMTNNVYPNITEHVYLLTIRRNVYPYIT